MVEDVVRNDSKESKLSLILGKLPHPLSWLWSFNFANAECTTRVEGGRKVVLTRLPNSFKLPCEDSYISYDNRNSCYEYSLFIDNEEVYTGRDCIQLEETYHRFVEDDDVLKEDKVLEVLRVRNRTELDAANKEEWRLKQADEMFPHILFKALGLQGYL